MKLLFKRFPSEFVLDHGQLLVVSEVHDNILKYVDDPTQDILKQISCSIYNDGNEAGTKDKVKAAEGLFVYVAIDDDDRPRPIPET